jgi:hypothetical protein
MAPWSRSHAYEDDTDPQLAGEGCLCRQQRANKFWGSLGPVRRGHFFSTMQLDFLGQLALRRSGAAPMSRVSDADRALKARL